MKKIRKFYREHRIFTILMAIALVCLIIIGNVLFQIFGSGGKDKYGDRLDGIEEVEISKDKKSDIEASILSSNNVKSAEVTVTGKIVYIRIVFTENISLIEAEGVAQKSLEQFDEDEQAFYDFHFTLKQDQTSNTEGFLIEGAKNVNGSGLIWENNNPVTSDDDSEESES